MIPGQDLGVRLQALLGWLGNYAHMPYTKMRELLFELGGIDIGEGTLVATNERVAQAIESPVEALSKWVKNDQPNVHVDETPWSVKGVKEWLLFVANKTFCLFHAALHLAPKIIIQPSIKISRALTNNLQNTAGLLFSSFLSYPLAC